MNRTLAVIAKAPRPGRVKTRLCPPLRPSEAARLAAAALADTLDAVRAAPAARRVLCLDGPAGAWADGFELLPQRGASLAERLAALASDVGGPFFVVGMDTPQLTPALLTQALDALERSDAAIGAAADGGYWGLGLRRPDPRAFAGVPMSRADTGRRQRERLAALGLSTVELPELRDVDVYADAVAVAATIPGSRFARALRAQAA